MINSTQITIPGLLSLKADVASGKVTTNDLNNLEKSHCGSILGERIREYLLTEDSNFLAFTEQEAFRIIVNKTTIQTGAPVMKGGKIIPAPSLDMVEPGFPAIYSKPYTAPGLLALYWQDEPLERVELESGHCTDIVRHAPLDLQWNGRDYVLVAESGKKSFYFEKDNIPRCVRPWLRCEPQKRADLATGLKRQGYSLNNLKGIEYTPEVYHTNEITIKAHPASCSDNYSNGQTVDVFGELGVLVVSNALFTSIGNELGVSISSLQGTLWFENGAYFKGTITSEYTAGIPAGFYGGVKFPDSASRQETVLSVHGSIMTDYALAPWTPSMNRQQTDYAGIDLPLRVQMPDDRVWIKATTGFPAFVHQFNQEIIAKTYRLFNKINVSGYAGKVSVGTTIQPVQFIVTGPDVNDGEIRQMSFLFAPSLPIHTSIMKVDVLFKQDQSMPGNLIQLNLHENNLEWVAKWYMAWAGRDCDGDGITLTDDPVVMKHAETVDSISWVNTLAFKSEEDIDLDNSEEAIRAATGRIRSSAHLIGKFDKIARRILRAKPELMTDDIRLLITEAIQRAISAQKKNSGVDRFEGYYWLLKHLPEDAESWLFDDETINPHDAIDDLEGVAKAYLNAKTKVFYTRSKEDSNKSLIAEQKFQEHLEVINATMPKHYQTAVDMLVLLQTPNEKTLNKMKARGRALWESAQSGASRSDIIEVLNVIDRSKTLWQSITRGKTDDEYHGLSFREAARIIRRWISDLAQKNYRLTVSAAVREMSFSILGHLLDIDDLQYMRLADTINLPVFLNNDSLTKEMTGTKQAFSRFCKTPAIRALKPDMTYIVTDIQPFHNFLWLPNREKSRPVTDIVTIQEAR